MIPKATYFKVVGKIIEVIPTMPKPLSNQLSISYIGSQPAMLKIQVIDIGPMVKKEECGNLKKGDIVIMDAMKCRQYGKFISFESSDIIMYFNGKNNK